MEKYSVNMHLRAPPPSKFLPTMGVNMMQTVYFSCHSLHFSFSLEVHNLQNTRV